MATRTPPYSLVTTKTPPELSIHTESIAQATWPVLACLSRLVDSNIDQQHMLRGLGLGFSLTLPHGSSEWASCLAHMPSYTRFWPPTSRLTHEYMPSHNCLVQCKAATRLCQLHTPRKSDLSCPYMSCQNCMLRGLCPVIYMPPTHTMCSSVTTRAHLSYQYKLATTK